MLKKNKIVKHLTYFLWFLSKHYRKSIYINLYNLYIIVKDRRHDELCLLVKYIIIQ